MIAACSTNFRAILFSVLCVAWMERGHASALESVLVAVDNSAFMVNQDIHPSRIQVCTAVAWGKLYVPNALSNLGLAQCQFECVNLVCTVKTQNSENTIGLMTMACRPDESPAVPGARDGAWGMGSESAFKRCFLAISS